MPFTDMSYAEFKKAFRECGLLAPSSDLFEMFPERVMNLFILCRRYLLDNSPDRRFPHQEMLETLISIANENTINLYNQDVRHQSVVIYTISLMTQLNQILSELSTAKKQITNAEDQVKSLQNRLAVSTKLNRSLENKLKATKRRLLVSEDTSSKRLQTRSSSGSPPRTPDQPTNTTVITQSNGCLPLSLQLDSSSTESPSDPEDRMPAVIESKLPAPAFPSQVQSQIQELNATIRSKNPRS